METDVATDESNAITAGYDGYDNAVDYSYNGANYDPEIYKNPKGDVYVNGDSGANSGDGVIGWYSEPPSHAPSRPLQAVMAAAHHAGHMMTVDVRRMGWLAMTVISVAKLMALKALKFLVFLAVKLKLLLLFKLFLFAKFFVIGKIFKFFILPILPSLLSLLKNITTMMMPSSSMSPMMMPMMMPPMSDSNSLVVSTFRNASSIEPSNNMRSTDFEKIGTTANVLQVMTTIPSAKCVDRIACHVAGTRPTSFQSIWMDW